MMDRWIVEEKKGGFFFLDRSRHRAIFPSLCAAGILRDKSDKSIRHAELTYDPRCRVCVHVANLLPLRPDPWERATFLPQYVRPHPRIPLFSLSLWTEPQVSLSLSLSDMIVARPDLLELGRNFVVTFPRTNFPGKRKMNYYPSGIPVNPGFLRCKSLVEAGNSGLGIMQRIIGLWRNWNRLNWG